MIEAYNQRKKYEAVLVANAIARLFRQPEEPKMSSDAMMAMFGITPKGV